MWIRKETAPLKKSSGGFKGMMYEERSLSNKSGLSNRIVPTRLVVSENETRWGNEVR